LPIGKAFSFLIFFEKTVTFGRLETLYIRREKRKEKRESYNSPEGKNTGKENTSPREDSCFWGQISIRTAKKVKKIDMTNN